MDYKPNFNRFLAAVRHEEADRVPLGEILIERSIQGQFLGREIEEDDMQGQIEFWSKAGYDYIPIPVTMLRPGKVTGESKITRILKDLVLRKNPNETDERAWNLEHSSFIHDRKDFETFPWDEAADIDYSHIDMAREFLPEGMKVIAVSGKIFTLTWMLLGFTNFCEKLMLEDQLVQDVFDKIAAIQMKALDHILSLDYVGGVLVVDDVAYGTGPMISPNDLQKYVFARYREVGEKCHAAGRILCMHSDGDLTNLMNMIIDTGIDVIHPMDPGCMDIAEVKKQWGDKICFIGNVSNEMLRSGTEEEIIERVKYLIKHCAHGGGYALGSGNSVPGWAKFENYMTMRRTAMEFGEYPIKF